MWIRALACAMVAIAAASSGCVRSNSHSCGDGTLCPEALRCLAIDGVPTRCVDPDVFPACAGLAQAAECAVSDGGIGTCQGGACIVPLCGDEATDAPELCDDGNVRAGDGCSSDCRSVETCGNETIDLTQGEQCDRGLFGLSGDGCTSVCKDEYPIWRDVTTTVPRARNGFRLVTAGDGNVALLGGTFGTALDDHWSWDGVSWLQVLSPTVLPSSRRLFASSYDPDRDRIVMFGGVKEDELGGSTDTDELWEWDGVSWSQLPASGPRPSARASASLACGGGRCVLFGGRGTTTGMAAEIYRDLWAWNGTAWSQLQAANGPTARASAAMVYDQSADRFVLVGGDTGADGGGWTNETWTLVAGGTWQPLAPVPLPTVVMPSAAYDPTTPPGTGRVIVTAQSDSVAPTLELVGSIWSPQGPQPNQRTTIAYAPRLGRVLAIADSQLTAFSLQADATWTATAAQRINAAGEASSTFAAYDARRGVTVAVDSASGTFQYPATWEWNGIGWRRARIDGVPLLTGGAVAYDRACGATVLVGGQNPFIAPTVFTPGTWRYDGAWSQDLGPTPPGRSHHAMTYDSVRNAIVVFGGATATGESNETWRYQGATCNARVWSAAQPALAPSARSHTRLAFDARRGVALLFGGSSNGVELGDTWEWDGTAWIERTPATSPVARSDHAMAFDARRGRVVLFGGTRLQTRLSDTWEWDGTTWSKVEPVVAPPPQTTMAIAPDVTGGLVVVGGNVASSAGTMHRYHFEQVIDVRESCVANTDSDGDGLAGCADPDCWARCAPLCAPGITCDGPGCGDATCQAGLENYLICPADCTP